MLECRRCAKEDSCRLRGDFARAVWLAWGRGERVPVCDEFVELEFASRGDDWRHWRSRKRGVA